MEKLYLTAPRMASSEVSLITYFEAMKRDYGHSTAKVEMAQAPQPELHQHYVQPPM